MQSREIGSSENVFRYLPITQREVATIPDTLRQVFQPYLQLIQSSRNFIPEGGKEGTRRFIGDVAHDVRKYRLGDRDGFYFYAEFEDTLENRSIELKTDRNYSKVEAIEVLSHKLNNEGGIIGKTWTRIDLAREVYVEQQVEPIPMELQDKSCNKQTFILNTRDSTLARLIWSKDKEEHPIITITPTEETMEIISFNSEQIRTDLRTGERLIKGSERTIRLPRPDEFVAQAIKKVVNLEPITFSLK